jgi:hypothetical protein
MGLDRVSFAFAFVLSVGSLLFYLLGAIVNRQSEPQREPTVDFNLGLPSSRDPNGLFATTLVAAGTSLSTVFVFFLTAGAFFGWWLLLSPLMFAVGNWFMLAVYRRSAARGYLSDAQAHGAGGLIPYLARRLTGDPKVGVLVLVLSILNLIAVLVLELKVGAEVLLYLGSGSFGGAATGLYGFLIFAVSVALLFGYVFVGGFRAVVASDVWQMRAMRWAVVLAITSLVGLAVSRHVPVVEITKIPTAVPAAILWGFVLNVVLANLFAPVSQEASWQRFRAFHDLSDYKPERAMERSVVSALLLWAGLALMAFQLMSLVPATEASKLTSMSGVLEVVRTLNTAWFPLFVFPILAVAALSAMYSTADTCVSAIFYLIEYFRIGKPVVIHATPEGARKRQLPVAYYGVMIGILLLSVGIYELVTTAFAPTILQLVFSVFSNLVVIAPTVLLTTVLDPVHAGDRRRATGVATSLVLGFIAYWTTSGLAIAHGGSYLWLSQLSILCGLVAAALPTAIVYAKEQRAPAGGPVR